jgi:glycosyltransferase involved in cell wall biosynthesis
VLAISQRTKNDLVELYRLAPDRVVVTPLGADPDFVASGGEREEFLLLVGSIESRKRPLVAADAAQAVGRRLVVVGPERDAALAAELRARGADVRGFVAKDELIGLYQRAAAVLAPTSYEGFGLTVAEAMACGAPVVAAPDAAVRETGADAVAYAEPAEFASRLREVLAEPDRWSRAGLERARQLSWDTTAAATAAVYRDVLG